MVLTFPIARRLDKKKFFFHGAGIFSSITAALFPLTVIKTRMMALDTANATGLGGAYTTTRTLVQTDGFRGLYRGFGTVICGAIPARMMYLAALEMSKSGVSSTLRQFTHLPDTVIASSASFAAGAVASLAGQVVLVPIDVISQRQMIMGSSSSSGSSGSTATAAATPNTATASVVRRVGGITLAQKIIQEDGVRGLYRGFGASVATFVPSSAIWWASYGGWQSVLWHQLDKFQSKTQKMNRDGDDGVERSSGEILRVQIVAGVLTGCTSAALTTPLDVIKTRLQTRGAGDATSSIEKKGSLPLKPTWRGTASELIKTHGIGGLYRGLGPRMLSTSIWGTTMVTTYEFLKRLCMLPPPS